MSLGWFKKMDIDDGLHPNLGVDVFSEVGSVCIDLEKDDFVFQIDVVDAD